MIMARPTTARLAGCLVAVCLAVVLSPARLDACSVPVFRYALERWQADWYEIDLFYRGKLTESQRQHLDKLEGQAAFNGGTANFEMVRSDLDGQLDDDLLTLWQSLGEPELPLVVVRLPLPGGRRAVIWHGKLEELTQGLFDSPARREVSRRLLNGDSVVWLVIGDANSQSRSAAAAKLAAHLPALAEEIGLPSGVGLPGSELMSRVPLEVRFTHLSVDANDPQEAWLLRILRSQAPANAANDEALVAAICGRGRVFEVFRARDFDGEVLADVCRFLCGACSCQVKQLNPGFDLITATAWEEELFGAGESVTLPQQLAVTAVGDLGEPQEVPIPPGRPNGSLGKTPDGQPSGAAELARQKENPPLRDSLADRSTTAIRPWAMIGIAICLVAAAAYFSQHRRGD
jgi:hypothetical protein